MAAECPDSHPWVIEDGAFCCKTYEKPGGDPLDLIQFEDKKADCLSGDIIPCSRQYPLKRCRIRKDCMYLLQKF